MPCDSMQEGIAYGPRAAPGPHFALMLLEVAQGAGVDEVRRDLEQLWLDYEQIKKEEADAVTALIGFGRKLFEDLPLVTAPAALTRSFDDPVAEGGGLVMDKAGIPYADDVTTNPGNAHVVVQFTTGEQLAAYRLVGETCRALAHDSASLQLRKFYFGYRRRNARGWLGFHDGLSNLASEDRPGVIEIRDSPDTWTNEGTYLAFMRLAIDLEIWNALTDGEQEMVVGRDKQSGCPLVADGGGVKPVAGCTVPGKPITDRRANRQFLEPPRTEHPTLGMSHVQRANRHIGMPESVGSARIFRQGYDFLEPCADPPGFRVGLNFVSFQNTPTRVIRLLTDRLWFGDTNFGGDPTSPDHQKKGLDRLVTARAAGFFIVPPRCPDDAFPGEGLFKAGS